MHTTDTKIAGFWDKFYAEHDVILKLFFSDTYQETFKKAFLFSFEDILKDGGNPAQAANIALEQAQMIAWRTTRGIVRDRLADGIPESQAFKVDSGRLSNLDPSKLQ